MNRIKVYLMALIITLTFNGFAHAQAAPNHDAIINALMAMKKDINKMLIIVHKHKAESVDIAEEQVALSEEQLTQLINKYNALKASLVTHYGELP